MFLSKVRNPVVNNGPGIDLYYTVQCPFAPDYAQIARQLAVDEGVNIRVHHLDTQEKARAHSSASSTYSLYKNGIFITHEIQTAAKLLALASDN